MQGSVDGSTPSSMLVLWVVSFMVSAGLSAVLMLTTKMKEVPMARFRFCRSLCSVFEGALMAAAAMSASIAGASALPSAVLL